MANLFLGKINLSKIDKDKLFKSTKTTTDKNGKVIPNIWMEITVWLSDTPDDYGNNLAIQQSTGKDEKKIYIGNCKPWQPPKQETVQDVEVVKDDIRNDQGDGLPF